MNIMVDSFKSVLEWLVSVAGMGVMLVYFTQWAKKLLKLEDAYAMALSAVVALVVATAAFFALKYELYTYAEEFWPVFGAWLTMVLGSYGLGQLYYKTMPKTNGK